MQCLDGENVTLPSSKNSPLKLKCPPFHWRYKTPGADGAPAPFSQTVPLYIWLYLRLAVAEATSELCSRAAFRRSAGTRLALAS